MRSRPPAHAARSAAPPPRLASPPRTPEGEAAGEGVTEERVQMGDRWTWQHLGRVWVGEVTAVRGALVTAVTGARAALCAVRPFRPLVEVPAPGARFTAADAHVDAAFLARALGTPPGRSTLAVDASAREARPGPAPAQIRRAFLRRPVQIGRASLPNPAAAPGRREGAARAEPSMRGGGRGRVGRWWRAAMRRA
jgi:hypothetical protein